MPSMATKRAMATALAAAAVASSIGAPAASARPVEQYIPSAAGDASDSPSVPPPPSSIAAPAGAKYEQLRSPGRTADRPTPESQPVVDEPSPSNGFDLPSAAIGAAAGTGVLIALLATAGLTRRRRPLTRRHGAVRA
jgi:hypothetical protein